MKKIVITFLFVVVAVPFSFSGSTFAQQDAFTLQKGWNLISFTTLIDLEEDGFFEDGVVFTLNPVDKKYYGGKGNIEIEDSFEVSFKLFDDDYFPAQGFWVYNESKTEVPLTHTYEDRGVFEDTYILYKGWNLIGINSIMEGSSLDEIKGNCEFSSVYSFEWGEWQNLLPHVGKKLPLDSVGMGFAIKVKDDCQFDFSGSSNVPNVPSLPTN